MALPSKAKRQWNQNRARSTADSVERAKGQGIVETFVDQSLECYCVSRLDILLKIFCLALSCPLTFGISI
jgi:hypothetical protein